MARLWSDPGPLNSIADILSTILHCLELKSQWHLIFLSILRECDSGKFYPSKSVSRSSLTVSMTLEQQVSLSRGKMHVLSFLMLVSYLSKEMGYKLNPPLSMSIVNEINNKLYYVEQAWHFLLLNLLPREWDFKIFFKKKKKRKYFFCQ